MRILNNKNQKPANFGLFAQELQALMIKHNIQSITPSTWDMEISIDAHGGLRFCHATIQGGVNIRKSFEFITFTDARKKIPIPKRKDWL